MSKKPFEKFINKELSGAAKKEKFRQLKRQAKAEARAAGEAHRRKLWEERHGFTTSSTGTQQANTGNHKSSFNPKKTAAKQDKQSSTNDAVTSKFKRDVEKKEMPLNKFVAYCGICGRREAAELIKKGLVSVNGQVILEPGFKVISNEDIKVNGKKVFLQKNLVYILLNKPKDYLTTVKDPSGRKTVFDIIQGATQERIYPVGRLDRNTTGVLLLTNDGELAQKLTHPSYEIKKVYEVKLDKAVTKADMDTIATGFDLEDGFIFADSVAYIDSKDKTAIGIEIHSGRNRIVRRIFEHLGYDVKSLDRVMFANLTKKNVERGKWRFLQEKEVRQLKFLNQSFMKKAKAATTTTKAAAPKKAVAKKASTATTKAEPTTAEKIKKLKESYFNYKVKQLKDKETTEQPKKRKS